MVAKMIDSTQLREYIVRPTLQYLDDLIPYSMAAENLLLGTCAQESEMGLYIHQTNGGPAQGIFQMEPETETDIWANFLYFRLELSDRINDLLPAKIPGPHLIGNLYYAAAMCRTHYYRQPESLPSEDDVAGLAYMWKRGYNTSKGKGTIEKFIDNYERYVK